jgi:hypothetical protein
MSKSKKRTKNLFILLVPASKKRKWVWLFETQNLLGKEKGQGWLLGMEILLGKEKGQGWLLGI